MADGEKVERNSRREIQDPGSKAPARVNEHSLFRNAEKSHVRVDEDFAWSGLGIEGEGSLLTGSDYRTQKKAAAGAGTDVERNWRDEGARDTELK